jgi:hypothetical protein
MELVHVHHETTGKHRFDSRDLQTIAGREIRGLEAGITLADDDDVKLHGGFPRLAGKWNGSGVEAPEWMRTRRAAEKCRAKRGSLDR